MFFKKTTAFMAAVLIAVSSGAVMVFAQENEPNRTVPQEMVQTERTQGPESTPEPDPPSSSSQPPAPSSSTAPEPEPEPDPEPTPDPEPEPDPGPTPDPEPEPDPEPTPDPPPAENHNNNTNHNNTPVNRPVTNANTAVSETGGSSEAEASSSELSSALIPEDVSSDIVSLPDVGSLVLSVPNAMGSGTNAVSGQVNRWYGVIAWICIGLGVAIVLVILVIGNRRSPRRRNSVGRKRYRRKPYKSGKKHLLDDRYYSNKYRRR